MQQIRDGAGGTHTVCCSWPSRSSGRALKSCRPLPPCPWDQERCGGSSENRGSCGPCPAQGPPLAPTAWRQMTAWSSAPVGVAFSPNLASLRSSRPVHMSAHLPRTFTWAVPSARGALPHLPGYSRDLLQDGEHPAPRAGPAGDERLVVHNHPLVVIPAEPREGGLNRPRGHSPSSPGALAPCCLLGQRSPLPGSRRPCTIQVWCL